MSDEERWITHAHIRIAAYMSCLVFGGGWLGDGGF